MNIQGEKIDTIEQTKPLGTIITNNLKRAYKKRKHENVLIKKSGQF